jgi:hypothetical protein
MLPMECAPRAYRNMSIAEGQWICTSARAVYNGRDSRPLDSQSNRLRPNRVEPAVGLQAFHLP